MEVLRKDEWIGGDSYHDHACIAPTTGFILRLVGETAVTEIRGRIRVEME